MTENFYIGGKAPARNQEGVLIRKLFLILVIWHFGL